jgi:hypothetical protein
MSRYFVRFVNDRNQALRDRRRGYSFSSYALFPTLREAKEFWADMLQRPISDEAIGRCRHGYGLKLAGLCGFGPFGSYHEAREYALAHRGYNGIPWPAAAIYTGSCAGQADGGDGDMFHPRRLVKFIEFDFDERRCNDV